MPTTPYDVVNVALNLARGRLNDSIVTTQAVSGKLLDMTQPQTQVLTCSAFRKFQEKLANLKYSGSEQEMDFAGVPGVTSMDPLVQVSIGFNGYFDGTVLQPAPALPQNLIRPYKLWERPSGTTQLLTETDEVINGLPSIPKMSWNRQWEWRDDVLYMPGATVPTDIRMRFAQYFADFLDNSPLPNTPWYGQPIPVMRCSDAFADYICCEAEIARQNPDAAMAFQSSGEAKAMTLVGRDTTQAQATPSTAQIGKMRDGYTPKAGQPNTAKR